MIETLVTFIRDVLLPLGAWGVLAGGFLEEIVAPVPSSLVMLSSGFVFLTWPPGADFWFTLIFKIVLPLTAGITIGSLIYYYLGYAVGRPFIERFGRYLGVNWGQIEQFEIRLKNSYRDELVLLGLRVVPVVPNIAINLGCGLLRYPWQKFLPIIILGSAVRAAGLAIIGAMVGEIYLNYASVIDQFEKIVLVFLVASGLVYLGWRRKKQFNPSVKS